MVFGIILDAFFFFCGNSDCSSVKKTFSVGKDMRQKKENVVFRVNLLYRSHLLNSES